MDADNGCDGNMSPKQQSAGCDSSGGQPSSNESGDLNCMSYVQPHSSTNTSNNLRQAEIIIGTKSAPVCPLSSPCNSDSEASGHLKRPATDNLDEHHLGTKKQFSSYNFCNSDDYQDPQSSQSDSVDEDEQLELEELCINCTYSFHKDWMICPYCQWNRSNNDSLLCEEDNKSYEISYASDEAILEYNLQRKQNVKQSRLVLLAFNYDMMDHQDPKSFSDHPERPERLPAIVNYIARTGLFSKCLYTAGRLASEQEIILAHNDYVPQLLNELATGQRQYQDLVENRIVTPDTYLTLQTYDCARRSAGCCIDVVEQLLDGKVKFAMSINRPPGHHAESNTIMGFCPLNNAAIAARVAQERGLKRILLLDWDVHHGNGTEEIFYTDPGVVYVSIHRHDYGSFYPGTGAAARVGYGDAAGHNINIPWDHNPGEARVGNGDYLAAFRQVILPIAEQLRPELVIVSAGFDAVKGDPIGKCRVTPACFGYMTHMLIGLGAPLALLLEGGYNLDMTARSVASCLRVLQGQQPVLPIESSIVTDAGKRGIIQALKQQRRFWSNLEAQCQLYGIVQDRPKPIAASPPAQVLSTAGTHNKSKDSSAASECPTPGEQLLPQNSQGVGLIGETGLGMAYDDLSPDSPGTPATGDLVVGETNKGLHVQRGGEVEGGQAFDVGLSTLD